MIKLQNAHIILDSEAAGLFSGNLYVQLAFQEKEKTILIAKDDNDLFVKLHKASRTLMKDKDLTGRKSINIRELLMDFDLDDTNREMNYKVNEKQRILIIYF